MKRKRNPNQESAGQFFLALLGCGIVALVIMTLNQLFGAHH